MRFALLIVGLAVLLAGLLWLGQGTGIILWPETSFMLRDMSWAYIGGATALAGVILILLSLRR